MRGPDHDVPALFGILGCAFTVAALAVLVALGYWLGVSARW